MERSSSNSHPSFTKEHVLANERRVHYGFERKIKRDLDQHQLELGNQFENRTEVFEQQPSGILWNDGDSKFRQPSNIGARLDEDFADAARAVDASDFFGTVSSIAASPVWRDSPESCPILEAALRAP
jgi:hypothetical protein